MMLEVSSLDRFKEEVRENIRAGAQLDWSFIFMNSLAATIACYGLFANSPAVVIGAMIVAMLLGPIAGIALALVDSDSRLLGKGIFTLSSGTIAVLFIGYILGSLHSDLPITNEIMARTSPNIMDLMIALAGGAAGAYATVSPRLSVAFVGVAIATALVPPLCSASILFSRGEYKLGTGAFLLAFTNMVAIQFASSAILWFKGFRRVTRMAGMNLGGFLASNAVSILILGGLAIALTYNLQKTVARQLFETSARGMIREEIKKFNASHLAETRFETKDEKTIVRAVMRGPVAPTGADVARIESDLPKPPDGTNIELRIRFVNTDVINRDGQMFDDPEISENKFGSAK